MAPADPARTAERLAYVERHLRRVADLLPERSADLRAFLATLVQAERRP